MVGHRREAVVQTRYTMKFYEYLPSSVLRIPNTTAAPCSWVVTLMYRYTILCSHGCKRHSLQLHTSTNHFSTLLVAIFNFKYVLRTQ